MRTAREIQHMNNILKNLNQTWHNMERTIEGIDKSFHEKRKVVTEPICRLFILLRLNQSHITAIRLALVISFLPLWMKEQYHVAALMIAVNIVLDALDGDLARFLRQDSDIRKFEDITADNIMVVVIPLALISKGQISGLLGGYYIFVLTFSWWLSVVKRNKIQRSAWLFRAQASSFLFFVRFCTIILLLFIFVLFQIDIFTEAILAISLILTIGAVIDYVRIIKPVIN
jgi:phosphatidylglycerophosphate synthase